MTDLRFSRKELQDFAVAWLALAVAFMLFLPSSRRLLQGIVAGRVETGALLVVAAESLLVVGTGFVLHELAHKVVAVRFGRTAEFRADYNMLGLAILASLAGFLFAAPGAVYHYGPDDARQHGLVALAGPAVNLVLAGGFFLIALVTDGLVGAVADLGLVVNVLLAGFNMLPIGPLDGRTVLAWSKPVFAVSFLLTTGTAAILLFDLLGL